MARRRWSPGKHPRDARGRFRPKFVSGSTHVGVSSDGFVGVKHGRTYQFRNGRQVLVKGIVGTRKVAR